MVAGRGCAAIATGQSHLCRWPVAVTVLGWLLAPGPVPSFPSASLGAPPELQVCSSWSHGGHPGRGSSLEAGTRQQALLQDAVGKSGRLKSSCQVLGCSFQPQPPLQL